MKNAACIIGLLILSLSISGCYRFVVSHPEKSDADFYKDNALCEDKARAFALERLVEMTPTDEIDHARRCMRELGWEYGFRKTSKQGNKADKQTEND
ncbi:MAG: hypothetical protein MI802_13655 [Desulfobacterales bacterium]|nr:hypothetical protein [Desulfobacterales bacterium]